MSPRDIITAWKNESVRNALSAEARASLPPNPAGLVELDDDELTIAGGGTKNSCTTACPSYMGMCCTWMC